MKIRDLYLLQERRRLEDHCVDALVCVRPTGEKARLLVPEWLADEVEIHSNRPFIMYHDPVEGLVYERYPLFGWVMAKVLVRSGVV